MREKEGSGRRQAGRSPLTYFLQMEKWRLAPFLQTSFSLVSSEPLFFKFSIPHRLSTVLFLIAAPPQNRQILYPPSNPPSLHPWVFSLVVNLSEFAILEVQQQACLWLRPLTSSPLADLSSVVRRRRLVIPDIPDGKTQKCLSSGALIYRHVYIL